ncbi:adenylyltransferase/cytidyltransferase family protein [Candidatus Dojkabacteria bacterium]|nr:adenylyltransferase/cytidyltransferase family protein [Candidatus Dojkabacteria bacterium]
MNDVVASIKKAKAAGKKVGFISGIFDVLHIGHVRLFAFAKKHCDFLVVCIDNDVSVSECKGPSRPIFKEGLRKEVLSALRDIDLVFVNPVTISKDPKVGNKQHLDLLRKLMPDVLITSKKSDRFWEFKRQRAKDVGIEFVYK